MKHSIVHSYDVQYYQRSNKVFLYDLVGSLSNSLGSSVLNNELMPLLLPPLLANWNTLSDDDPDIFPLLECLNFVAIALGPAFAAYSTPVFGR